MDKEKTIKLNILTGPTGVGKTSLAIDLATKWNTEIISVDSMQIYRELSIGTAKPVKKEYGSVRYHLIDCVNIEEQYNLARFIREANEIICCLAKQGKCPLLVGGTGLYIKGLLEGIFEEESSDKELRENIRARIREQGLQTLYKELESVDPVAAGRIKPGDTQRIVRALEVYYTTGVPISLHQEKSRIKKPRYCYTLVILIRDRNEIYDRIEKRVDTMFEKGLVDEVRGILDSGFSPNLHPLKALGYREVIKYLEGKWSLEQAKKEMKKSTRRYAKRQLTWFRSMPGAKWINLSGISYKKALKKVEYAFIL